MTSPAPHDFDSAGLLFGVPKESDLASWRQATLTDTRLGAPRSCWEEAGLAWAEAVERHRNIRPLPEAHRLAATPVWVYGQEWENRLGTGVWSDGLHLWVAYSTLQALRQEDLAHPLSYYDGTSREEKLFRGMTCNVHVPPPVSALARTLLEVLAVKTIRHPWASLQAMLAAFGEQAWLDGLPEGHWTQARTDKFIKSRPWNKSTQAAWDALCQASLAQPADWSPLGWDKDPWTPYSPVWLRRLHGSGQHAHRAARAYQNFQTHASFGPPTPGSTAPNVLAPWLRAMELWMTLAHATPDMTWRAACSNASTQIVTLFEVDKAGLLDRLPWWPPAWSREAVEGDIYVAEDGHPHMLWNRLSAAIRDGADPVMLAQGEEMPALHVLLKTWGNLDDAAMRQWLSLWSPAQPQWWLDQGLWACGLPAPATRWLLEQGATPHARFEWEGIEGTTPLHLADHWDADTVQHLIQQGADVNALDSAGRPAFWSVKDVASLDHVLAAGADVTLVDPQGQSAVNWQVQRGIDHGDRYETIPVVTRLLQAGTPFWRTTTDTHASSLRQACRRPFAGTHTFPDMRTPLLELLHAHGAEINELDAQGRTLLHEMLQPINNLDQDEEACGQFEAFLARLVALGADPWHRDSLGQCAFTLALAHGYEGKLNDLGHQAVRAILQSPRAMEGNISTVMSAESLIDDSSTQAIYRRWMAQAEKQALASGLDIPVPTKPRSRV